MNFHVISIFPDFVKAVFEHGVVRRAVESGRLSYTLTDPRDFTGDKHRTTDDTPYGGGPGMVMLAEPLYRAVSALREQHGADTLLIYLSPSGELLTQGLVEELAGVRLQVTGDRGQQEEVSAKENKETKEDTWAAKVDDGQTEAQGNAGLDAPGTVPCPLSPVPSLILLCGRYEGVDQRVLDELGAREVSIGDYVLSGGELAAMVLIDAVARLLPGVLGNEDSAGSESFTTRGDGARLLDWPHYTRPENWRGRKVPEVLLSGNHARILGFREEAALLLTYQRRPDLLTPELRQRAERLLESLTGPEGPGQTRP